MYTQIPHDFSLPIRLDLKKQSHRVKVDEWQEAESLFVEKDRDCVYQFFIFYIDVIIFDHICKVVNFIARSTYFKFIDSRVKKSSWRFKV